MAESASSSTRMLRDLAAALRQRGRNTQEAPALPAPTDEDILRAVLAKPLRPHKVEPVQTRKMERAIGRLST